MLPSDAVLITGCSTGIGLATAERLAGEFTVYASARKVETLRELETKGCRALHLDVTDEDSMHAAVEQVEADCGSVGALVNNAGYSQSGALETLSIESVRAQFETNVFGLLRLSQLVLPGMRRAGGGRIVNIGSMGGKLTFPGGGVYHATKHAVEALSDAMRFEVQGFGRDVQQGRAEEHRGCLPGTAGKARRGTGDRRRGHPQVADHQATSGALHGHAVGEARAPAAPDHPRCTLGPHDAVAVPGPQELIWPSPPYLPSTRLTSRTQLGIRRSTAAGPPAVPSRNRGDSHLSAS